MIKPAEPQSPSPDFAPIPEEDLSYSKLAVVGIFLATLPLMIIWAALVIVCLPIKGWNLFRQWRGKQQFHFINALIREFFDMLAVMIRYPFAKSYHYTEGNGKPILLVHGYLHNASAWHSLIRRLKEENFGPIYAVDLGDGSVSGSFWSIKQYARQLLDKTEQISQATGRKDISIIAHSMGGLVTAAYAKLAPQDAKIDIITLGSPLDGAPIASHLASGPNGRSMIPGSHFIEDLKRGMRNNADHIQFRHIAAKHDFLVPLESALLDTDPRNNVTFDDIGHTGLITSRKVADQICAWLKA